MTLLEFAGCSLIAFGPSLAMFTLTIATDPIRIIILISSAFFWLLSLLLSSIFWFFISSKNLIILGVLISVIFQELFRYLFYQVLRKAETGLRKVSEVGSRRPVHSISRVTLSYVSGLGFGVMSGAFSLINVLADMIGPGTVGLYGDSPNFFITSAFTTHAFILLHTFWGVIFFNALDFKKYFLVFYVILTHFLVSSLTLFNQKQMYMASLFPCYLITLITGYIAFLSVGGSLLKLKTHLFKSNSN